MRFIGSGSAEEIRARASVPTHSVQVRVLEGAADFGAADEEGDAFASGLVSGVGGE